MTETTVVLPSKEEMLERLLKVSGECHLQNHLYPKLLQEAGQEKLPMGVVMMLELAIHDYTEGMPPMVNILLNQQMPDFIDALIPDEEAAKEAKDFFAAAMAAK